jgi:hypothetical protein
MYKSLSEMANVQARRMSSAYVPSKLSDVLFYHFSREILDSRGSRKADQAFESGALHFSLENIHAESIRVVQDAYVEITATYK